MPSNLTARLGLPLATYTADTFGTLITASTAANTPSTAAGFIPGLTMSPSGMLLAAPGQNGLPRKRAWVEFNVRVVGNPDITLCCFRLAGNTDISAQQGYHQTASSPQTPDILLGKFGLA